MDNINFSLLYLKRIVQSLPEMQPIAKVAPKLFQVDGWKSADSHRTFVPPSVIQPLSSLTPYMERFSGTDRRVRCSMKQGRLRMLGVSACLTSGVFWRIKAPKFMRILVLLSKVS